MNELRAVGSTAAGETLFMIGADGHEFVFRRVSHGEVVLHTVGSLPGVEQQYDCYSKLEELPASVRRAITVSNYRLRSTATSLEGAMS